MTHVVASPSCSSSFIHPTPKQQSSSRQFWALSDDDDDDETAATHADTVARWPYANKVSALDTYVPDVFLQACNTK